MTGSTIICLVIGHMATMLPVSVNLNDMRSYRGGDIPTVGTSVDVIDAGVDAGVGGCSECTGRSGS